MTSLLGGALLAGLMGSPHCVGMCGGFAAATHDRPDDAAAWHLGRMSTYALLGGLLGALGERLPAPGVLPGLLAGLLLFGFSARLAGLLPEIHLPWPSLTRRAAALLRRPGWTSRFAFGMMTGLLPCGLLWAALALPLAAGSASAGALVMATFAAGTTPLLLVAAQGVRRLAASHPWARRGLALAVLVSGLWSLAQRQAAIGDDPDAPPACHGPQEARVATPPSRPG
jgi:hypothetical protein